MDRTKNTLRNIIWGMLNKFITLLFPFILRSFIIRKLGSEYLGLSSLFTSILQVLNLTEMGFSSAIVFSMYKPIAENDTKTICALTNYYKKIYRIIGCIIGVMGIIIAPFIPNLISGTYPSSINIYILYFIYLTNTVVTYFLFAYKSAILTANQRSDIISNANSVVYIIQYFIQILVLCAYKNYYMYVGIMIITNIINNILIGYITNKKYPQYVGKENLDRNIKKDIKKRVMGLIIQKICATTRNSLDSIFLSMFLGLNIVAIYSNYYTIMNSVTSVLTLVTSSMVASIGNSIVKKSISENFQGLKKFDFMYMWISGWFTICLLCLFQPFMKIWMGENYLMPLSTVVLFCIYFYALKMGDIRTAYNQATGLWWEGKYRALAETLLNIILNYFLGKYFGVNGIIIATILSVILVNFIYGSTIIFKYYFKQNNIFEYYFAHLEYIFITLINAVLTYFIISKIKLMNNIINLLVYILICCIVPNVVYIIFYQKNKHFKESTDFVKNIFNNIENKINN